MWGDIAIAFLLAFITAFVLTPYTMRLAKKVGAIDIPNDRRVNKKPMPRLRRLSCYLWIFSINCIFINCNEFRKFYQFIWRRTICNEANWLFYRYFNIRNGMFYR
ncbi:MAG: hypothetical protein HFJ28_03715 [Clostridia bacterium]|nr:hypothetical protein [Clostridia bacterium]